MLKYIIFKMSMKISYIFSIYCEQRKCCLLGAFLSWFFNNWNVIGNLCIIIYYWTVILNMENFLQHIQKKLIKIFSEESLRNEIWRLKSKSSIAFSSMMWILWSIFLQSSSTLQKKIVNKWKLRLNLLKKIFSIS